MRRAIVLAHFDPHGLVDDYVVHALGEYRRFADRLIMVSSSTRDPPAQLAGLVDAFIARENVGYDFCSWRAGIEALGSLESTDELVCVNDSVYGPLKDLGPTFGDPRVADADAWGMCMSLQGTAATGHAPTPHLQSWFIAMRAPVLRSEAFRAFWSSVVPLPTKADVIDRYELGLSASLQRAGFRVAAVHDARTAPALEWTEIAPMLSLINPVRSVRLLRRACRDSSRHNPMELRPIRILGEGVPFVKASVFRINPYRLSLPRIERELQLHTHTDLGWLHRHQRRVGGWQ